MHIPLIGTETSVTTPCVDRNSTTIFGCSCIQSPMSYIDH